MRDIRTASVAAVVFLLFAACSGDSGSGAGMGTVNVHLTDAPIDMTDVQSVTVTITDVTLYPSGDAAGGVPEVSDAGAVPIPTHPDSFDLLTLTGGATTLLASGEAPAGHYQRIRLDITDATLTFKDGTVQPLKIDSGKVDVPIAFNLGTDESKAMTLDFDAAASVQVNLTGSDQYILRPVVTPVN